MQDVNDRIEALGATLVALTPQSAEKNQEMIDRHSLSFDLLHDKGNAYAAQLGIRYTVPVPVQQVYAEFGIDIPGHNGEDSWTLPIPARLVVDQAGIIRAADIDLDYTRRPEPEKTLDDLRAL